MKPPCLSTAMLPLVGLVSALLVPRIPPPPRANVQLCDGVDTDAALTAAEQLLADYDRGHQAAAKSPNAEGLGGALTANAWALKSDRASLADAVRRLRSAAGKADGRIMLGFCADDATEGIAALKAWVTSLDLPRGVLHGMDRDGVPIDMSTFGSVYIKYNSQSTASDAPGTAVLSGYAGDFRGVYFNPDLMDGEFRQYAVLPADLFEVEEASATAPTGAGAAAAADDAASAAAKAYAKAARAALLPLLPALAELGAVAVVEGASADGVVRLRYAGPPKLRLSVEMAIRGAPGVARVELVEAKDSAPESEAGLVSSSVGGGRSRIRANDAAKASVEEAVEEEAEKEVAEDAAAAVDSAARPAVPTRFAGGGRRFISSSSGSASASGAAEPDADPLDELHSRGWAVLRRASGEPWLLDADTLAAVRGSKFEPIFNGHQPGEEPLRFMGRSYGWASALEAIFTQALDGAGLLVCGDGVTPKVVNDCYALRSLPCVDDDDGKQQQQEEEEEAAEAELRAALLGRQPAHSDVPLAEVGRKQIDELPDADVPLSVLLAIQPGTKLWVFPRGCDDVDAAFLVRIEVGDIMVWRGDLVHAGAGYLEDHVRIHAYVDPPATIFSRPFGKTNRCAVG